MNRLPTHFTAIATEDVLWARTESARQERRLVDLLEERSGCGPAEFVARLAATLRIAGATLEEMRLEEPAFDVIPFAEASRRSCVALRSPHGELSVVFADPYDLDCQDWIEQKLCTPFRPRIAHRLDIASFLSSHEERLRALDGVAAGMHDAGRAGDTGEEISFEAISETDSTVVRLVNSTIYDALKTGASDIHLEATGSGLAIKYRIDGVLTRAETMRGIEFAAQVISRIKVMSDLDIAERRVPQDGRFKARSGGREIDFRVSVMPSVFGEDAVLRVLDKQALSDALRGLTLDQLGFDAVLATRFRKLCAEPYGMVLVTGPTGSGKTTTLYAVITEVNQGHEKIVTIEDPVEYQLAGVLQIPVHEEKGLTFARGLRSILRHDPDRIMVGEIRDSETAEIAVQSALTGHLVYTTVHANSVFDVLGRFRHMGIDSYNLVSALNAVLAQRLVRLNCRACAVEERPDRALLAESRIPAGEQEAFLFMRGRGCVECRGTGFKGRKAVGELLVMTDELSELVVAKKPVRMLREAAIAAGTIPLRKAALELARRGESTLEEVNRVTLVA